MSAFKAGNVRTMLGLLCDYIVFADMAVCTVCACIPRPAGVSLLIQAWRLSDPAPNPPAPSDLSSLGLCGPVASAVRP